MKRRAYWVFFGLLCLNHCGHALGGDFTLTAHDGSTFALSELRDKIVVLSFGYTSCPDVCPTALTTMSATLHDLGEDAKRVQGVFVSLDPDRDIPERLAEYVRFFHPDLVGVTGTKEQLRRVADAYRVRYDFVGKGDRANYALDHSANMYLIGKDGKLKRILPHGLPARALTDSIVTLFSGSRAATVR